MEPLKTIAARVLAGHVEPQGDASREARKQFAQALDHLAAAYRHEMVDEAVAVYWHALKDVSFEIRAEGMSRCAATLKFFPTVAELRTACADVVDERRKVAGRIAAEMQATCEHCDTTGWRAMLVDGVERVTRCECFTAGQTLIAAAGAPIVRPQLPAVVELDA